MAYVGYHFFVGDLELPYAPSELKLTIGSNNKTFDLINGNEINILKNPKLTEIEFEIELPRGRQYAFANKLVSAKTYTDYFEQLMVNKTPVQLVITRPNRSQVYYVWSAARGTYYRDTSGRNKGDFESNVLTVSLEGYDLKESADNAYDVTVSLKFKQYLTHGTVKKVVEQKVAEVPKPLVSPASTYALIKHTVKKGDRLWTISKQYYGTSSKWKIIYNANKAIIEATARRNGKKSSSNGHWIYPGTKLVIPTIKK